MSFTTYVLEQRVLLAERQLRSLDRRATITEIAYATGFSDLSYFSRCFRRRFGVAPRDFHAMIRRRQDPFAAVAATSPGP